MSAHSSGEEIYRSLEPIRTLSHLKIIRSIQKTAPTLALVDGHSRGSVKPTFTGPQSSVCMLFRVRARNSTHLRDTFSRRSLTQPGISGIGQITSASRLGRDQAANLQPHQFWTRKLHFFLVSLCARGLPLDMRSFPFPHSFILQTFTASRLPRPLVQFHFHPKESCRCIRPSIL